MSPIGNMIIVGVICGGGAVAAVATARWIGRLGRTRPMKIIPFEEKAEPHGDIPHVATRGVYPAPNKLRDVEPRGA